MILMVVTYLIALAVAFPLSLTGMISIECNKATFYEYHLIFAAIVVLVFMPTDFYAYIANARLSRINE